MYQIIPFYILKTKIYLFSASFLQFEQITGLKSIDSHSDVRDPLIRMTWQHNYVAEIGSHLSD
jgi:hypothetical protein